MATGKSNDLSKWLSSNKKSSPIADERPVILVIDDDESVLDALKFAFRDRYDVRLCSQSLRWDEQMDDRVDVVVLDIKMSGRDGFWVYNAIREKFEHVPIIFNSAYQDLRDPTAVMNEYRPFGYIVKGDRLDRLLRTIERAVAYRRGLQAATQKLPPAAPQASTAPAPAPAPAKPPAVAGRTSFTTLPPVQKTESAPASTPAKSLGKPVVLFLDDDPTTLHALRLMFSDDYDMRLCISMEAAIKEFNECSPSVVVLDLKLRGRDGFEVCEEIRKHDAFVPIIFYTAHPQLRDPYEVMNSFRPFAYIIKDGDERKLRTILASAVDHYQRFASHREVVERLRNVQSQVAAVMSSLSPQSK